jgi:hypothetical protein
MESSMTRLRPLGILALCVGGLIAPLAASAQACADQLARRKITIVVPFKPGGGNDAYARLFAPVLQEHTGGRVAVTNLPGANGLLGAKAVAKASADQLTLGVFDLRDLISARLTDPTVPTVADYVPLGTFGQSFGVWASAQAGGRWLQSNQPLTFGVSTGLVPRVLLPAMLLGREVKLVRGYGGMSERWLALLRGEVDLTDGSHDTLARFVASAPGTGGALVLASHAIPEFPGVPHLAGPGGLVDQRTRQLPAAQRRTQMELAELAAELSTSARTIAVSRATPPDLLHCLESAVDAVLASRALRDAADVRKLHLEPARGVQVRAQLSRIEQAIQRNEALLKRLAAGA